MNTALTFVKGFCTWLPFGPRLKTGANKLQGVVNNERAEFFARPTNHQLPLTFHFSPFTFRPSPACAQIQHFDEGRECHGEIDVSFIDMLAETFSN
jgi:hypothetical protein